MEGFGDYEKRSGLGPSVAGSATRSQVSGGTLAGIDRTFTGSQDQRLQLGVLGGYNYVRQRFDDGLLLNFKALYSTGGPFFPPNGGFFYSAAERDLAVPYDGKAEVGQSFDGPTVGLYGSYAKQNFFFDGLARVDFFDMNVSRVRLNAVTDANGCIPTPDATGAARFSTEARELLARTGRYYEFIPVEDALGFRNYVMAGNAGVRYDLTSRSKLELTTGARFTYAEFDSKGADLGIVDGHVIRLQAGAHYRHLSYVDPYLSWTNSIGIAVYSDVLISGFSRPLAGRPIGSECIIDSNRCTIVANPLGTGGSSALGPGAPKADEGAVRVSGTLQSRLDMGWGASAFVEINARYGDDYWGAGGRIGGRIEW